MLCTKISSGGKNFF